MENSAEPPAPSHVWPLVAKRSVALLLTASKASAASASVAELPRHLRCGEIGAQKEHIAPRQGLVELSAEGKLYHMVASGNKNSCNCTLLEPQALEPQAPSLFKRLFPCCMETKTQIYLGGTCMQHGSRLPRHKDATIPLCSPPFLVPLFLPSCCHSSILEFFEDTT